MLEPDDAPASGWRGTCTHFLEHIREDWPAALFVAAFIALIHNWWGWFDAVDGYAFVAIGNLSSIPESAASLSSKPKVLVVLIDQRTHEINYLERSPLSRCQLKEDLKVVYELIAASGSASHRPRLVVIDVDISPVLWLIRKRGEPEADKEFDCQKELYKLIAAYSKTGSKEKVSKNLVHTVLMTPFDISADSVDDAVDGVERKTCCAADFSDVKQLPDADIPPGSAKELSFWKNQRDTWKADMEACGTRFGQAQLPLDYGLTIKHYCDPRSLARVANTIVATETGGKYVSERNLGKAGEGVEVAVWRSLHSAPAHRPAPIPVG